MAAWKGCIIHPPALSQTWYLKKANTQSQFQRQDNLNFATFANVWQKCVICIWYQRKIKFFLHILHMSAFTVYNRCAILCSKYEKYAVKVTRPAARHEICQKVYTAVFSGQKFYTPNFIKFQQFWSSNTNKLVKMEKFTPQCRWQRRQFSPLIPDCLKTFQTVCKISTLSGNLPKWAEAFQTVWYISLLCLDIILWSILLVRAKTFWSAMPTRQRDFWDSKPPHD